MSDKTAVAEANNAIFDRGKKSFASLMKMIDDPKTVSEGLLFQILSDNKDTEYGRKCNFSKIKNMDDFKKNIPFSVFDDYVEYVVREINGEKDLHSVYGTRQYNRSSGTMGNPKKIPMSQKSMDFFFDNWVPHSFALANHCGCRIDPGAKTLSIVEASGMSTINEKRYAGISSQSVMEWIGNYGPMLVSPLEASIPDSQTDSRYLHVRYGLSEKNVGTLATTFMTFVLDFFHYMEHNWEMICDDIESGKINPGVRMSDDIRRKLESELTPMPERAAELRSIFSAGIDNTLARRIWPNISFIMGVSTGTFSAYLKSVRERYVGDIPVVMTGISASEGVLSVPFEIDNPYSIPTLNTLYVEFLPLGEEDQSKTKSIDEVELNGEYELVITTFSGLYRYRTRDAIRVTGFHGKVPTMEYLYRIDMCVNLNGEKTYEPALRKAVDETAKEMGFSYIDFTVNPNTDVTPSCYEFFIEMDRAPESFDKEIFAECLKKNLCEANPLLVYKFERQLCGPVMWHRLQEETYLLWRDKQILLGAASTQVKPVKIIMHEAQLRFFKVLIEEE